MNPTPFIDDTSVQCPRHGGALNSFCASVSRETREQLCACDNPWVLEEGSWASRKGLLSNVVILQCGLIAGNTLTSEGKPLGIMLLDQGFLLNVVCLAEGDAADCRSHWNDVHEGYAVREVRGCQIPVVALRRMAKADSALALTLLDQTIAQYKNVLQFMPELMGLGSEERVRWFFGELRARDINSDCMTHSTIAKLLKLNRVTITRAMNAVMPQLGSESVRRNER